MTDKTEDYLRFFQDNNNDTTVSTMFNNNNNNNNESSNDYNIDNHNNSNNNSPISGRITFPTLPSSRNPTGMQATPVRRSEAVKIGFRPQRSMTRVQKTKDGISIRDVRIEETNWDSE